MFDPLVIAYFYFGFDRVLADASEDAVTKPPYARSALGLLSQLFLWPFMTLAVLMVRFRFRKFSRALMILVLQIIWFIVILFFVFLASNWIAIYRGFPRYVLIAVSMIPLHYVLQYVKCTIIAFLAATFTSPETFIPGFIRLYGHPARVSENYQKAKQASGELRHTRWNKYESDLSNIFKSVDVVERVRRTIAKGLMAAESATTVPAWLGAFESERRNGGSEQDATAKANQVVRFTRYMMTGS